MKNCQNLEYFELVSPIVKLNILTQNNRQKHNMEVAQTFQ
jgi:hypothetical protein